MLHLSTLCCKIIGSLLQCLYSIFAHFSGESHDENSENDSKKSSRLDNIATPEDVNHVDDDCTTNDSALGLFQLQPVTVDVFSDLEIFMPLHQKFGFLALSIILVHFLSY